MLRPSLTSQIGPRDGVGVDVVVVDGTQQHPQLSSTDAPASRRRRQHHKRNGVFTPCSISNLKLVARRHPRLFVCVVATAATVTLALLVALGVAIWSSFLSPSVVEEMVALRDALALSRARERQLEDQLFSHQMDDMIAKLEAAAASAAAAVQASQQAQPPQSQIQAEFDLHRVVNKVSHANRGGSTVAGGGGGDARDRVVAELERLQWFHGQRGSAGSSRAVPKTRPGSTRALGHSQMVCDDATRQVVRQLQRSAAVVSRQMWLAGPTLELFLLDSVRSRGAPAPADDDAGRVVGEQLLLPVCDIYFAAWDHSAASVAQELVTALAGVAASHHHDHETGNWMMPGTWTNSAAAGATTHAAVPLRIFLLSFRQAVNFAWHYTLAVKSAAWRQPQQAQLHSAAARSNNASLFCVFAASSSSSTTTSVKERLSYSPFKVQRRTWSVTTTGRGRDDDDDAVDVNVPTDPGAHLLDLLGVPSDFARTRFFPTTLLAASIRRNVRKCFALGAAVGTPERPQGETGGRGSGGGGPAAASKLANAERDLRHTSWARAVLQTCELDRVENQVGGGGAVDVVQVMPWQSPRWVALLYNVTVPRSDLELSSSWSTPEWLRIPRRSTRRAGAWLGHHAGRSRDPAASARHLLSVNSLFASKEDAPAAATTTAAVAAGAEPVRGRIDGRSTVEWVGAALKTQARAHDATAEATRISMEKRGGGGVGGGSNHGIGGGVANSQQEPNQHRAVVLDIVDEHIGADQTTDSGMAADGSNAGSAVPVEAVVVDESFAGGSAGRSDNGPVDSGFESQSGWMADGTRRNINSASSSNGFEMGWEHPKNTACSDACGWPLTHNGRCDDGSGGSGTEDAPCAQGTDCSDCRRPRSGEPIADIVLQEPMAARAVARAYNVDVAVLCMLNAVSCARDAPVLPAGSELISVAHDAVSSAAATATAAPWWTYGPDVDEGSSVLVDWTGDGRNVLEGTIVAVAHRRGAVRVVPHPDTRPYTAGAGRWFARDGVMLPSKGVSSAGGGGSAFANGMEDIIAEAAAIARRQADRSGHHHQETKVYFDLPVLVPHAVAAPALLDDADAAARDDTSPMSVNSSRTDSRARPLAWKSWVFASAWYPDNSPFVPQDSRVICNINAPPGSSSWADTPRPVSVRVADLERRAHPVEDLDMRARLERLNAAAQVQAAAALFSRASTTTWPFPRQAAAAAADNVNDHNADSRTNDASLVELYAAGAAARGRTFFLLYDSVQVWRETCGLPHRWSQPGLPNDYYVVVPTDSSRYEEEVDEQAAEPSTLLHFGVFMDSDHADAATSAVVEALVAIGFDHVDADSAGAKEEVTQVDLRVPSACVPITSPLIGSGDSGSAKATASSDVFALGPEDAVEFVTSVGHTACTHTDQRVFFGGQDHGRVTVRLNFFHSQCSARGRGGGGGGEPWPTHHGGGGTATTSGSRSAHGRWCDARLDPNAHVGDATTERRWSVLSPPQPRARNTWGSRGEARRRQEWTVKETQDEVPLCWVDLHGSRIPAQCI